MPLLVSRRDRARGALLTLLAVVFALSVVPLSAAGIPGPGGDPSDAVPAPDRFEVDNTMATAKQVIVGEMPQYRTIHAPVNADFAKFSAKAGTTYRIEDPGFGYSQANLGTYYHAAVRTELLNAKGEVLMTSDGDEGYYGPSDYRWGGGMTWRAPATATYYVRVTPYDDYPNRGMGEYLLWIHAVTPSIMGRVTDGDGEPIVGCYVSATTSGVRDDKIVPTAAPRDYAAASTYTDTNGYYVLGDLPNGDYAVYFDHGYYGAEYYDDVQEYVDSTRVTVTGTSVTTGIDAQLTEDRQFQGRVVDEDGMPLRDIEVYKIWYYPGGGTWGSNTYTDEDGYYRLPKWGWGDGDYTLSFRDYQGRNLLSEYWDDQPSSETATRIQVVDGKAPLASYDATLTYGGHWLTGTVKNAAGQPLDRISVEVWDSNGWSTAYTQTNAAGIYRIPGSAGTGCKLRFYDNGYRYESEYYNDASVYESATPVSGTSDEPTDLGVTVLEKMPPALAGTVTDAVTGAPIPGIQVWQYIAVSEGEWRLSDMVTTDAKGKYAFEQVFWDDTKLKFTDPSGFYSVEWFNNAPSMSTAETVWLYPGADVNGSVSLLGQSGRMYGATRFSTAVAIAKQQYPDWTGCDTIVLASGDDRAAADPLAASSLCWAADAPLLLTCARGLPAETLSAIKAANQASEGLRILVVGGPRSVPDAQLTQLKAIVGAENIERLPFGDRYETARQVALRARLEGKGTPSEAIIANGADPSKFFDALSASAVSASTGAPILLVSASTAPSATVGALRELEIDKTYVVGGRASVGDAVYNAVSGDVRISGANRYATSVAVAEKALAMGWLQTKAVGIAAKVPDALAGGVAMGRMGGPLLVTAPTALPAETYGFIDKYDQFINQVIVYGGPSSCSTAVGTSVKAALKQ